MGETSGNISGNALVMIPKRIPRRNSVQILVKYRKKSLEEFQKQYEEIFEKNLWRNSGEIVKKYQENSLNLFWENPWMNS